METRARDDVRDLHDRDRDNDVNDQQSMTSEAYQNLSERNLRVRIYMATYDRRKVSQTQDSGGRVSLINMYYNNPDT